MSTGSAVRKDLAKVVAYALLSLLAIPLLLLAFVRYAQPQLDADILASIERQIDADQRVDSQNKARAKAFYRANPPSALCKSTDPALAEDKQDLCPQYSAAWHFATAKRVANWTLALGALALLAALALGAWAYKNRAAHYASFVLGWRLLSSTAALQVVLQGAMLVWLTFWLQAFFWQKYSVKLILVIGFLAAVAMFFAISGIFRRPVLRNQVSGEPIAEADAPALWAQIRTLAKQLKTAPPQHIVAGIDTNFFVTEAPLSVGDKTLTGRSLFVSLPLLRLLSTEQANAVLAHELAHFRGGDAASSAALGPKLAQYADYLALLHSSGLTRTAYYLMHLYRVIFEFALQKDSREREFLADRIAAKLVSPAGIAESLIKIAAYARYRSSVENQLFGQQRQLQSQLGIAQFVAQGLPGYAASGEFLQEMKTAQVPHPFDSHPSLAERMHRVSHRIPSGAFEAVITAPLQRTWVQDIPVADAMEQRQWAQYETQFAAAHEEDLAYRYQPASSSEAALVAHYFPPAQFALKGSDFVRITYSGLLGPGQAAELGWDEVKNIAYENGSFGSGDTLTITHPEKTSLGLAKTTKIKLRGIKDQREKFQAVLGHYWKRHQVMRTIHPL